MKEADLLAAVLDLAKLYGWRTFHARAARTARGWRTPVQGDGVGFPDLVMVKESRNMIVAELKAGGGRVTPAQQRWLDDLGLFCPAYIWRVEDWRDGAILSVLSA